MRRANVLVEATNWNRGHYDTCTNLFRHWPALGRETRLFCFQAGRQLKAAWTAPLHAVTPLAASDGVLRRLDHPRLRPLMRAAFRRMVHRRVAPGELVIAWPGVSTVLTRELKAKGCTVVVEFINTHYGWAREVLEAEQARLGLEWGALDDGIATYDDERAAEADVIFAPNRFVEESIRGRVPGHGRLLPTSYGAPLVPGQRPRRPQGGRFTFLFVGQFGVRKGAHTLIEACRNLGDRIMVEVAGRVTPDIEAYAARHGMPSNIRQLGFQRDMGEAYDRADALVFPSLEEGGPRVCYEAAAYGLPMVVTEVGGGRIAEDGGTGYVVPPSNPEALADAMLRLAGDPDRYEAFSARALEAVKPFAWERVAEDRHLQLLELGF